VAAIDEQAFLELARDHSVVPVWRELSADTITPVAAFLRLVGGGTGFLLESAEGAERWSRFSFVGRNPEATLTSRDGLLSLQGSLPQRPDLGRGLLCALDEMLASLKSPHIEGLPPLHGGLVGYLGYDVVREVERLPDPPPDDQGLPEAMLWVVGEVAAFDHWRQLVVLVANVLVPEHATDGDLSRAWVHAQSRLDRLAADLARPAEQESLLSPPPDEHRSPLETSRTMSSEEYCRAVRAAKDHIFAGDIFQVVLSQRFDFPLHADPFDCYRVLRQVNPSPYMYFLRHPEVCIVGSSPEPMVKVLGGRVISRPIAGTRRRGRTEEEDRHLEAELAEHPKERAEHIMLVDLARNDVGRVVEYGTETVDELMTMERYSHVMHLTSQVSGQLRPGVSPVDVLRATLPAGTVSGAPKVRAMELIDHFEPTRRGPYAGVVGYLDFSGNLDTAIAIRTMVVRPDGTASVQAGAGVVADSDPAAEDAECASKAAALLSAVQPARQLLGR
jgi:anthranilate synthase component I